MEYVPVVSDPRLTSDAAPEAPALASADELSAPAAEETSPVDGPREPLHRVLPRLEKLLREIRTSVEAQERDRRFAHTSPLRWGAAVTQLIAVGFLAGALIDWLFQTPPAGLAGQLTKLGFAVFFQLATATIVLTARAQEQE